MKTSTQIVESFTTKGVLLEQAGANDAILCRAKYQICSVGEKNRNNRVYEKAVWDKVLADPDISEKLKNRSLFFHAEHPTTTQSNTEKVAGVVTNIIMNEAEKKVYAVMEVLDTPYGRIVDTLLRAGCGIGVSTRADGELEEALDEAGNKFQRVVPESYRFVTIDFTADPSTFGSELPIAVERDVTKVISGGLDDSKIDRDFATVLLETMHSPEAVALLESIRSDKHHADCPFKASEKRCNKGCKHVVTEGIITKADLMELGEDYYKKMMDKFLKQGTEKAKAKAEKIRQILSGDVQFVNIGESEGKKCPKCGKDIWDKANPDQELNKCWNCGARFDEPEMDEKYTTSSDKSGQPANAKAAAAVVKKSAKAGGVKVSEMNLDAQITKFLLENWDGLIDHDDAVRNVMSVFKTGVEDAKRIVETVEASKGKISAVGAGFNEKASPSGIHDAKLEEMSVRLASTTAEREKMVENYGKDAVSFTTTIKELREQLSKTDNELKTISGLVKSQEGVLAKKSSEITTLKEQLEKSNEAKRVLEETHKQAIQNIQEERVAEVRRLGEEKQKEIDELKESQKRDLIKFYVGTKVKGMGLRLPESVLTLLEACKTTEEVDAQIRKTQNALREGLVQSAGVLSEIVIESQSEPNPAVADISKKVGIALKHFGA